MQFELQVMIVNLKNKMFHHKSSMPSRLVHVHVAPHRCEIQKAELLESPRHVAGYFLIELPWQFNKRNYYAKVALYLLQLLNTLIAELVFAWIVVGN